MLLNIPFMGSFFFKLNGLLNGLLESFILEPYIKPPSLLIKSVLKYQENSLQSQTNMKLNIAIALTILLGLLAER